MIIGHLSGGLGNQMFQYATCKAVALKNGIPLFFDIRDLEKRNQHEGFVLNKYFTDIVKIVSDTNRKKILGIYDYKYIKFIAKKNKCFNINKNFIIQNKSNWLDLTNKNFNNTYIEGYWQSFLNFENEKKIIMNDFTFDKNYIGNNKKLEIKVKNTNSISIHFRFGDYKNSINSKIYYNLSPVYYEKCINYIIKNVDNPVFYVFSDDPKKTADFFFRRC